jgi:hypothetical protein
MVNDTRPNHEAKRLILKRVFTLLEMLAEYLGGHGSTEQSANFDKSQTEKKI